MSDYGHLHDAHEALKAEHERLKADHEALKQKHEALKAQRRGERPRPIVPAGRGIDVVSDGA